VFERPPDWQGASYPAGCDRSGGHVRARRAPAGGLVVHATPCAYDGSSFRLGLLFSTGSLVFPTPLDMFEFWNGELAGAFGLEVTVERPNPQPTGEEAPPQQLVVPETEALRTPAKKRPARSQAPVTAAALAERLGEVVHGQPAALERVARVVATQLAKTQPVRPGTVMLLGPTGSGKTSTIEALPTALAALGRRGAHVFRVDCNELSERIQLTRLLGSPPGYVGYSEERPLFEALARPGCILLLDEIEKAHESLVHDVLLNLLDTGRLTAPDGSSVGAAGSVIALTTNAGVDELEARLQTVSLHNRLAVQTTCRDLLLGEGFPPELVSRIGAFAVYRELAAFELKEVAAASVTSLAREYGLTPVEVDPIIADVLLDIAGRTGIGARALNYAASELLGSAFAQAVGDGVRGQVVIECGPPIAVRRS